MTNPAKIMQTIIACPGIYGFINDKAVKWLIKRDYAMFLKGKLFATAEGLEWFKGESKNQQIKKDKSKWKTEVLTGAKEGKSEGGHTTLLPTVKENVAVESGRTPRQHRDFYTDLVDEKNLPEILAKELDISVNECKAYLDDNRIRLCHGYLRNEHVGVFDFRNKKKGYYNDLCRQCRKLKKVKK